MIKKARDYINHTVLENSSFGHDILYTFVIAIMCLASAIIVLEIIYF